MPIAQEEVFGPVLVMQAFDSEEEAVALANNSQYGLAASIWSTDVDRPLRIARQIEAGTVWINNWAIVYAETEEGGYKQSGLGRLEACPEWTISSSIEQSSTKSIWERAINDRRFGTTGCRGNLAQPVAALNASVVTAGNGKKSTHHCRNSILRNDLRSE